MKLHTLVGYLVGSALLVSAKPVTADLVMDFTGGESATPSANQTLGWDFILSETKTVIALGFWDEGGNGLAQNHSVALWLPTGGTPLAQVVVTNLSTPHASTQPAGRWLFQNLTTPLKLAPGTYVLGADYPSPNTDFVRTGVSSVSMAPGFSFNQGRFVLSATSAFDFPNGTFSTPGGHFGPNLLIGGAIPEPSSLLIVACAIGLFGCRHRIRKRAINAA